MTWWAPRADLDSLIKSKFSCAGAHLTLTIQAGALLTVVAVGSEVVTALASDALNMPQVAKERRTKNRICLFLYSTNVAVE